MNPCFYIIIERIRQRCYTVFVEPVSDPARFRGHATETGRPTGKAVSQQMQKRKKTKTLKERLPGLIAGAAFLLLFWAIFGLSKPIHFVLAIPLAFLIGWIVSVMSQGLDTSAKAPRQEAKPIEKTGNPQVDSLIERGKDLLDQIQDENAAIPDPFLTDKINELDTVLDSIFRTVADQPGKAPQIRRSMDYYLPTTLKMLTSYRRMDERNVEGQNAEATRKQIREAMDVVVNAFRRQLDAMYQHDMLDISTDIEVLETLLRQDGLVDSGLKEAKTAQENTTPAAKASSAGAAAAVKQEQAE